MGHPEQQQQQHTILVYNFIRVSLLSPSTSDLTSIFDRGDPPFGPLALFFDAIL